MPIVYLALGSNIGDRLANLETALARLAGARGPRHASARASSIRIDAVSPVYETEPVGYADQPWFLNAVVRGQTDLTPAALLGLAKQIETDLGRQPSFRNAPRPIDIDILFYDDLVVATPDLEIPHPRLADRAFVLQPLADLAPDLQHPVYKRPVRELLAALPKDHETVRRTSLQLAAPPRR